MGVERFLGLGSGGVYQKAAKMEPHPHALELAGGNPDTALNLMFRCGPCDVCGGDCLSTAADEELVKRLLSGRKPVGTFACRQKREATRLAAELQGLGLATWIDKNRWQMYIVVATLDPVANAAAFAQAFIDERMPFVELGRLYGYPPHMSEELDAQRASEPWAHGICCPRENGHRGGRRACRPGARPDPPRHP
jgi:hypothetical protein